MTTACAERSDTVSFFPGIVTTRMAATCEFYSAHFDFRPVQTGENTMVLTRADGTRLGLLRAGNVDQPAALQTPTRGSGIWLNLEVHDSDALYARACAAGVEVVAPPEVTASGTRRLVVRDPNGVLVYVTERAPVPFIHQPSHDHDQDNGHSFHRLSGY